MGQVNTRHIAGGKGKGRVLTQMHDGIAQPLVLANGWFVACTSLKLSQERKQTNTAGGFFLVLAAFQRLADAGCGGAAAEATSPLTTTALYQSGAQSA